MPAEAAPVELLRRYIAELSDGGLILGLLEDQFGNYVVQRALDLALPEDVSRRAVGGV